MFYDMRDVMAHTKQIEVTTRNIGDFATFIESAAGAKSNHPKRHYGAISLSAV